MANETWSRCVCLVTGSSGAVGSAVTAHLRSLGCTVVGAHSGREVTPDGIVADLTDEASVIRLFDEVVRRHGAIHIVIHTVGGFASGGRLDETSVEVWDRMMTMNVRSTFLCLRESLKRMRGTPYGRVVLFGAATGLELPPGRGAYGLSKAAVHHLAEVAAKETAGTSVTVNALAPRIIDTTANRRSMPDADRSEWVTLEEVCRTIERLCEPVTTDTGKTIRLPASA